MTSVNVASGQTVTAGQVLATQDPTSLNASLLQAQATLASADAKLSLDRAGTTASTLTEAEGQVSSSHVQYDTTLTSLTDTKAVNAQLVSQAYSAYTQAQTAATADGCSTSSTTPPCSQDEQTLAQDFQAWQADEVTAAQSDDQAQGQVNSDKVQWQKAEASLSALEGGSTTAQQIEMDQSHVDIAQVGVTNAEAAVAATTVDVPTTVKVTVSTVVTATALQTGQCLTAIGTKASSSTVSARAFTISPAGAIGCTAGFGGFGGGGGFGVGGRFGGGGGGGGTGASSA